jgi:hypothetical protein
MIRTQVYISPHQKKRMETLAQERGVSFAEIIRRALDAYPPKISAEEEETLQALADAVIRSAREADAALDAMEANLSRLEQGTEERGRGDT